jgi:hypothetical protein
VREKEDNSQRRLFFTVFVGRHDLKICENFPHAFYALLNGKNWFFIKTDNKKERERERMSFV